MRDMGLNQVLTYWAPAGTDRFGAETFATPILIKGRWEDRTEQVRTPSGDEITSRSVVFVDRPLAIGGYLAKEDMTVTNDPTIAGALEIQSWAEVPDLRNVTAERRAYL